MAPFCRWGSTSQGYRAEPLGGDRLLLTTQSQGVSGTNLIDLERIKGWVDLGATHYNARG